MKNVSILRVGILSAIFMLVCLFDFGAVAYASTYAQARRFADMYAQELKDKNPPQEIKGKSQLQNEPVSAEPAGEPQRHVWEIGSETYYFSYREPGVMRECGMMYGLEGSYGYHDGFMLKAEGRGAWGKVDYKNSGTINDITDYTFEFRGLGGWDFPLGRNFTLTPFFGGGYRYLNDDTSGKVSSTGAYGYERESNYIYSPAGIEALYCFGDGWSLGASAEYDIFWWGRQYSHLSDVSSGYNDIKNTQDNGYGIRGSLKLKKRWAEIDFMIEPFIRYWHINKSQTANVSYSGTIIGYAYEPRNNTAEYGIKAGVNF